MYGIIIHIYMNEFLAKKLGEVLAFAEVGIETFERGNTAMQTAYGVERVAQIIRDNKLHSETIRKIAQDNNVLEIVMKKLDGTGTKLRAMRDLYVGDQWDNPTELLEWSGFFEGAAMVHWALVLGGSEALLTLTHPMSHDDLILLANAGKELHEGILHEALNALHATGKAKAK
jgi:hypothetical protein